MPQYERKSLIIYKLCYNDIPPMSISFINCSLSMVLLF